MSKTAERNSQKLQVLTLLVDKADAQGDSDTLKRCDAALFELVEAMKEQAYNDQTEG